jgi:hypothetical protein
MVTTRSARSQAAVEVNGASTAETTPASTKSRARTVSTPSSSSKPEKHHDSKEHHIGHQYEFFGPHGPALLVLALPIVVYGLFFGCNRSAGCLQLFPTLSLPGWPQGAQLYSNEATLVFLGWFFGLLALHLLVDGKRVAGVVLPNGARLTYKLNGKTSRSMQSNTHSFQTTSTLSSPQPSPCSSSPTAAACTLGSTQGSSTLAGWQTTTWSSSPPV